MPSLVAAENEARLKRNEPFALKNWITGEKFTPLWRAFLRLNFSGEVLHDTLHTQNDVTLVDVACSNQACSGSSMSSLFRKYNESDDDAFITALIRAQNYNISDDEFVEREARKMMELFHSETKK